MNCYTTYQSLPTCYIKNSTIICFFKNHFIKVIETSKKGINIELIETLEHNLGLIKMC